MNRQTAGSRRGTVFVYGIQEEGSQQSNETLRRIMHEWRDWRVVVVKDRDSASGWRKSVGRRPGLTTPNTWRDAQ